MTQLQFNKWKTKYMSDVEHCYETLSDRRDRPPPAKAEIGAMKILKLEFDKLLVDKRFVPIHRLIKKSFHQFADEINSHLSGYETWGTRNRSHGRRRFPKMLVIDLLQVLEHAKNNRTSLDMIYDFLKPSGELEMWHNLKYKNQKRKISFRIPTKDAHSPTQWANKLRNKMLLTYCAHQQNSEKINDSLSDEEKIICKNLLERLGDQPLRS